MDLKLPPVGVILNDPTHKEWTSLDLRLAKAYHIREDFLVGNIPVYLDQSDRVVFDVKTVVSKSRAAMSRWEERQSKSKNKNPGLMGYPVPRTTDGGPMPTLEEWLEEQAKKKGEGRFGNGAGQ